MGSTRLPGKPLIPFAGDVGLLEFQLGRLRQAFPFNPIVVATSTNRADGVIAGLAATIEVECFRGDEDDVLKRFADCCSFFGFTGPVIRICGDNPLLQMDLLQRLMEEAADHAADTDYCGFSIAGVPGIRTHFGFFGEAVSAGALTYALQKADQPFYREHVTNYIYEHGQEFRLRWLELDELTPYLDSLRLTVDGSVDLDNAQYVYRGLKGAAGQNDPTWKEIISFLEGEPTLVSRMKQQIRLNQK